MEPLTIVCWRWTPPPGYRSSYPPATVNVLRRMVARCYPHPHRFLCVTDDPVGLDPEVGLVPAWNDFADVPSPAGGLHPSCYRRLRAFHPDIAEVFGPRFVSLDLDVVLTGDCTPLWQRDEDFVIWGDTNPTTFYNGSMFLLRAGARRQVWDDFHPARSPMQATRAGHHGSDQGWISQCLGPHEAKWSTADGVYSYRNHLAANGRRLPRDARVVVWHGRHDPWDARAQALDWVQEHYQ